MLGNSGWEARRYDVTALLPDWPGRERDDDLWLRPATLELLIDKPQGFTTEGLVLTHSASGRRVLLTVQTFFFEATEQASKQARGKTSMWNFRRRLLASFTSKVLVIGQLLTSGNYGSDGLARLSTAETVRLLKMLSQILLREDVELRAVLIKDISRTESPITDALLTEGFTALPVDPVMRLDLRPFGGVDDYLASLSSKYRVRYRRARGKFAGLTRRRLSSREARSLRAALCKLYRETSKGADFNLVELDPDYFEWLAEVADLYGYYNSVGELIGFTTGLPNGSVYQAHFLGLKETYKHSHHLYHNMLLDLLEDGLSGKYQELDYGRTALAIKSSVGAEPQRYATLLRLRSGLLNRLVPYFIPAVFEAKSWQPRSPFRVSE